MILSVLGLLWALTTGVNAGHEVKPSPQLVARRIVVLQLQDLAKRTTVVTLGMGQVATIATPDAPVLHISPTESSEKLLTLAGCVWKLAPCGARPRDVELVVELHDLNYSCD
jgi:hypothetical protein